MKAIATLNNMAAALASTAKVMLLSRPPFKRREQPDGSELVLLGNGPSLRALLDHQLSTLQSRRLLCVNFAANAPEFVLLRPEYYVLADPHFFNGMDSDPNVKRLWENIGKGDWKMTLFVPHRFLKKACTLLPTGNIQPFNLTPAEGSRPIVHPLYNAGLAMPRPRNVLIPSIMIGIRLGFKKIWLCGADHTWSRTLSVDEENRVISVQPHFYKDSKTEQKRVNTEYEGYRLHDILRSLYIAFRAYHDIAVFARRKGVTIINATPGSMIDAFPRGSLD